jgi:hypothetical protein
MSYQICDCCKREVDYVRGSMWHNNYKICKECFYEWYDPTSDATDVTDKRSIGNWVRAKHNLPPLPED